MRLNPTLPVSFQEVEIRTWRGIRGTCTQRDDHVKRRHKGGHLQAREASEETEAASISIVDFSPPEPWENKFVLFKPLRLRYFVMTELANERRQTHVQLSYGLAGEPPGRSTAQIPTTTVLHVASVHLNGCTPVLFHQEDQVIHNEVRNDFLWKNGFPS